MADELVAMFASITTSDHEALVAQFSKVLQIEPSVAKFFLESSSWNVETAINTFLASVGSRSNLLTVQTRPEGVLTCQPEFVNGSQRAAPDSRLTVMIHLKNTGTVAWPSDSRLVFSEGTQMSVRSVRVPLLEPGKEQFFNLEIRTPPQVGSHACAYRLAFAGGYFCEPMWVVLGVDAAAPTPAAAAPSDPTLPPVSTAFHGGDMAMDGELSPTGAVAGPAMATATTAAAPASAAPSIFAPSSFAAPSFAGPGAATGNAAGAMDAPPSFTFTGFRTGAAAQSGAATGITPGIFGGASFGAAPASAPAPAPAPDNDGDDMLMDL